MAVINTNITSLIGQNNLNKSQGQLQTAMERLSSGLRINSAKDDAAGQAIANRMTSTVTGLTQASRNANDGISLAQTAEGSLDQINDNLQRIRELTVQAQNGTNSAEDIDSIQKEVNQRLEEINRVTTQTSFNGTSLFAQSSQGTFSIQVGSKDSEQIDIKIQSASGWNTFAATSGTGFVAASAAGTLDSWASTAARSVDAQGFDVLSSGALAELDNRISSVDDSRSDLGAVQNRFETAIDNITTTSTNLSAARSRIEDADYAVEVSNMTRANILQQAGTSVLAQANQSPQSVLSLLQ
ncbi:MAG: flagellin FliC [Salinicola sp.]|uniref:flagellin N-terminal helical domain-containing protein n=1 Tax=uncultured Salinicola sp. TaxID=1193542 RepID=UPI000C994DA2|nr:flagellin [uncultured Salinicola sp.]MAM58842.1 flagellin FliC [Salinicola sp.]|tara:strand:- start:280 stop:1173 length:894 start_codon:yes stop_codon:yes gene_type:complete